jgi:hypothetical protein
MKGTVVSVKRNRSIHSEVARLVRFWLVILVLAVLASWSGQTLGLAGPNQDDWRPITILYQSDVGGKIEPCG